MLKLVFVALFGVQAFGRPSNEWSIESHIIGGTPAQEGQFPFIVSIRDADDSDQFCGGALISDTYILTAAHCVRDIKPSAIVVGAGSVNLSSQKIYKVNKIIVHPPSTIYPLFDDIALVRLSSPIPLGGNVQIVPPYSTNDTLDGKMVSAMGWGQTKLNGPGSSKLLYLEKPIVSNDFCKKRLGPDRLVGPGNICLGSELNYGMCFGDSGSPLAYKASDGKIYTVGIVSWGVACAKGYPDVFTRVSHYTKWIKENMK